MPTWRQVLQVTGKTRFLAAETVRQVVLHPAGFAHVQSARRKNAPRAHCTKQNQDDAIAQPAFFTPLVVILSPRCRSSKMRASPDIIGTTQSEASLRVSVKYAG